MRFETFALVVGGGPVGLSAAIDLRWRGVPTILITANIATTTHPKCNTTNARSMEFFRRLGMVSAIRAEQLPLSVERASAYVTRFCGHEFGRLGRPSIEWPAPELPANISQIRLEQVLKRQAESGYADDTHFGWRLTGFTAEKEGVVAQVEDVVSGAQHEIAARFMIAADGASSPVRRILGFKMQGEDGTVPRAFMGGTMLSYFMRAPGLVEASGRVPPHMTWIINREVIAMMYAQDERETWIVHYQVPVGVDPDAVDIAAVIRKLLGSDIPFEILSGGPWTGGLALVAECYQQGPVFLAGDAAHLYTPLGGLGMNTGIGDVMNLTWKIAALHKGWGGASLLDSYTAERRPIGLRNAQLGIHCARVMDGWRVPDNFEDDDPSMRQWRAAFGEKVMREDRVQYATAGIQLGETYHGAPLIAPDPRPAAADRSDVYIPTDRPGYRAPHFWSSSGVCLADILNDGFLLLDFGAAAGQVQVFRDAAAKRGIPLQTISGKAPGPHYAAHLVLVRPDQHIAWSGDSFEDAGVILDRARGASLGPAEVPMSPPTPLIISA